MEIKKFENRIGYEFRDPGLLTTALTHSSYKREHASVREDNERLEFIGDGILDSVIALYLYRNEPLLPEGDLTKIRALIVCEKSLAEAGRRMGINEMILLGAGEARSGGASKDSIIADAVEAFLGAVLIDGGYESCESVILSVLSETIESALRGDLFADYKSEFQELAQTGGGNKEIVYVTDRSEGPDHDKTFFVHVELDGKCMGYGTGKSKKEAGQNAAKAAIDGLKR